MKNKDTKKIFTISAVIFICELHTACSEQCSSFGINKNHISKRMEGHIILTTSEEKIQQCVKRCSMLNHCLSINYDSISGICELNSVQSAETSTDITFNEHFILSDLSENYASVLIICKTSAPGKRLMFHILKFCLNIYISLYTSFCIKIDKIQSIRKGFER